MSRFTAFGKTFELVQVDDLTFGEYSTAKLIARCVGNDFKNALIDTDPDAWLALVLISCQRVDESISQDQIAALPIWKILDEVIGDDAEIAAVAGTTQDESDPTPPGVVVANGEPAPSETPNSETTPEPSGVL